MTMRLYCFGESGNSYKAALALQLSGLDWQPVFVDFFGGETRTPEYRSNINELGEAPVLVDGDFRIGHPSGILIVSATVTEKDGEVFAVEATVLRTQRRLMRGEVYVAG